MKKITWIQRNVDKLLSCETDEQLKATFPDLKLESLRRAQRKFRNGEPLKKVKSLESFLVKGRTLKEITEYFAVDEKEAEKMLKKVPVGFELFKTLNSFHQHIYILLPKISKEIKVKSKVWKFVTQPDGQPYMWINLPKNGFSKIKVAPIADLHYGAKEFKKEKFAEYVNWIKQNDNVFCFLAGDIFENCSGESNRGVSIFDQVLTPTQQREDVMRLLAPIAHKILWAVPGNHENRSRKYDFDPLEYVCNKLDIPYFQEPVYVDVIWNDYVFTFFCQHGKSGSLTEGGKLNAAARPLEFQEHVHFTIMAHVHDAKTIRPTRIVRDRVNFKLIEKKQYVVICPAFLDYFGSYAARAVYKPGAWGTVTCEIYRNGDYHASA